MSEQDPTDRLMQNLNGTPQTLPDQRRLYLGSLRERVALAITNQQLQADTTLPAFVTALKTYAQDPTYKVLLNGKVDMSKTAPYMKAIKAQGLAFTLVNDDTASLDAKRFFLLVVNQQAIDHEDISLPIPQVDDKPAKRHWFDHFS
ncbi:YueI family protein [Lacticaseibacillus porcinae]|uniref:YueI family protein n=1 Tax=Lacticaseibacillus porcinae TaxID=1123687 RepID=UPI0013DE4FCE|nr:YueI family protein [Lacticaseibacillus porcinae]